MFDSPEELARKIRLGEDSVLELKAVSLKGRKVVEPKRSDLADEIAAMANSHDGVLVLGVSDDREVQGIDRDRLDDVERFVYEICNDSIRPPVSFHTLRMELPDPAGEPRPILKIDIPRSLFVHESAGGYYHRQGSSKQRMPPDVLARLFQQRSQARLIRFDEQTVPETSSEDLDPALYGRFLVGIEDEEAVALRKLRLLQEDDFGAERATVAAVLLCSRDPSRWLPGASIRAACYRGTVQDSNYQIDAREITGPLDQQILDGLHFVERNMRIGARKNPERQEVPQYSRRAVFEALVNAVAHRDYSVHGSTIRLFLFEDRLELYSPGSLPNTLTVESLPLRQSTRNELVASLLAKSPVPVQGQIGRSFMMDKRGEGVPIIFRESRELSGKQPEYRVIDDAEVLLTIWAASPEPAP